MPLFARQLEVSQGALRKLGSPALCGALDFADAMPIEDKKLPALTDRAGKNCVERWCVLPRLLSVVAFDAVLELRHVL